VAAEEAKAPLPWSGFPKKNNCTAVISNFISQRRGCQYIFFPSACKFRKNKNFIPKLKVGDQIAVSQEDKQAAVF
jgi:hypothetical protein